MPKLNIEVVEAASIRPSEWNPNQVSTDHMDRLKTSLDRLGTFRPVIVRDTDDGLEVVGGYHRVMIAKERGESVEVINLGRVDDQRAKEIALADNARFGQDDPNLLSDLIASMEIDHHELESFLPGHFDIPSFDFGSNITVDLETLGLDEATPSRQKAQQTHTTMRFRVPIQDAELIKDQIDAVVSSNGFSEGQSEAEAAGDALVWIFNNKVSAF